MQHFYSWRAHPIKFTTKVYTKTIVSPLTISGIGQRISCDSLLNFTHQNSVKWTHTQALFGILQTWFLKQNIAGGSMEFFNPLQLYLPGIIKPGRTMALFFQYLFNLFAQHYSSTKLYSFRTYNEITFSTKPSLR